MLEYYRKDAMMMNTRRLDGCPKYLDTDTTRWMGSTFLWWCDTLLIESWFSFQGFAALSVATCCSLASTGSYHSSYCYQVVGHWFSPRIEDFTLMVDSIVEMPSDTVHKIIFSMLYWFLEKPLKYCKKTVLLTSYYCWSHLAPPWFDLHNLCVSYLDALRSGLPRRMRHVAFFSKSKNPPGLQFKIAKRLPSSYDYNVYRISCICELTRALPRAIEIWPGDLVLVEKCKSYHDTINGMMINTDPFNKQRVVGTVAPKIG